MSDGVKDPRAALDFPAENAALPAGSQVLQQLRFGQGAHIAGLPGPEGAHQRGGMGSADSQELLEIAAGQNVPVERLELADRVSANQDKQARPTFRPPECLRSRRH
jgi:hypothetical protein